jgi:SAM-dependent methyltransferase
MTTPTYVFDNAWQQGRARLAAVEELLDPGTIRCLSALDLPGGARCLEVGAGGGSVAAWLCDYVGPNGSVVATDLDTRYVEAIEASNLEVRKHDVVNDDLESGAFDLVHTRLVLEHLPDREQVLGKLAQALKPGGWLLAESLDYVSGGPVSDRGTEEHARSQAIRLREFGGAGLDAAYGRKLPASLRAAGLTDVGNEGRAWVMEGGSPAARWFRLSMAQVRGRLVGPDKLTDADVDRMLELFDDPAWSAITPIIFAAWGRRPD